MTTRGVEPDRRSHPVAQEVDRDPGGSIAEQATSDEDDLARPAPAAARRAGLVKLFPHVADVAPEGWRVTSACVLGRGREAEIGLQDGRISRTHAIVEPRPG